MSNINDVITVWGRVDQIAPLLVGLGGVEITDSGLDSYDKREPVVEITFDPTEISELEIFHKILDSETGIGGLANSVGVSTRERK